jgi:O-antigen/teichoic acid export membrane protein
MRLGNVVWNLAGLGTPLVVAVITIPGILHNLGAERFGILTLAIGLITYSNIFDLGVGRAVTKYISEIKNTGRDEEIYLSYLAAVNITITAGAIGAILFLVAISINVRDLFNFSKEVYAEINLPLALLAMIIPMQALATTYRGINEGFEKFKQVNIVRIFTGTSTFLGPFLVSKFTNNLFAIFAILFFTRGFALYENLTFKNHKNYKRIKLSLLYSGGWFSVASIAVQLIAQLDRFLIAFFYTAAVVGIYTLPFDLIVQSLTIVGAVTTVLFPKIAENYSKNKAATQKYFLKILITMTFCMLFISCTIFFLLPIVFPYWLGKNYDVNSLIVGKILCIGLPIFTAATMLHTYIQATGGAKAAASIFLFEAPFFLCLIVYSIYAFGYIGAATAWVIRTAVDLIIFSYLFKISTINKS